MSLCRRLHYMCSVSTNAARQSPRALELISPRHFYLHKLYDHKFKPCVERRCVENAVTIHTERIEIFKATGLPLAVLTPLRPPLL